MCDICSKLRRVGAGRSLIMSPAVIEPSGLGAGDYIMVMAFFMTENYENIAPGPGLTIVGPLPLKAGSSSAFGSYFLSQSQVKVRN